MNLGPKWQENEITALYEGMSRMFILSLAYKVHRDDVEKIKENLAGQGIIRSSDNIRSLINKVQPHESIVHRTKLSSHFLAAMLAVFLPSCSIIIPT